MQLLTHQSDWHAVESTPIHFRLQLQRAYSKHFWIHKHHARLNFLQRLMLRWHIFSQRKLVKLNFVSVMIVHPKEVISLQKRAMPSRAIRSLSIAWSNLNRWPQLLANLFQNLHKWTNMISTKSVFISFINIFRTKVYNSFLFSPFDEAVMFYASKIVLHERGGEAYNKTLLFSKKIYIHVTITPEIEL